MKGGDYSTANELAFVDGLIARPGALGAYCAAIEKRTDWSGNDADVVRHYARELCAMVGKGVRREKIDYVRQAMRKSLPGTDG